MHRPVNRFEKMHARCAQLYVITTKIDRSNPFSFHYISAHLTYSTIKSFTEWHLTTNFIESTAVGWRKEYSKQSLQILEGQGGELELFATSITLYMILLIIFSDVHLRGGISPRSLHQIMIAIAILPCICFHLLCKPSNIIRFKHKISLPSLKNLL